MSFSFINNQPVKFVEAGSFNEDDYGRGEFDYKIPVDFDENDFTKFQIKVSPFAGTLEGINDPNFTLAAGSPAWASSGSGTLTAGLATIGDGSTGQISISTEDRTLFEKNYLLVITVQEMFGTAYVYNDNNLIGEINATGEQSIGFTCDGSDSIVIKIEDDSSYIEITNVSCKQLADDWAVAVLDVYLEPVEIVRFSASPEYFVLKKDTLTVTIAWDLLNIPKGCYYLAITDPETNTCAQMGLYNSSFELDNYDENGAESIDGWTGEAGVSFTPSGLCTITAATGTDVSIESNRYQLCAEKVYNITITARKATANDCTMVVTCGGDSETWTVNSGTATTYTGTITLVGNDYFTITNDNTPGSGSDNVLEIQSVVISLANDTDWSFEYITLYQYKLASFDQEDLKKIGIFNNEDGLGFVFEETEFYPTIRCESRIINRRFKYEKLVNENDNGLMSVAYGQMRGQRIFRMERHPNYLIDFFALIPIADRFFIDDVEFFVDSDTYEPAFDEELDNFANSEFLISEPQQLVRNINSGQTRYPPSPDGEISDMDRIAVITEPRTGNTLESR